MRNILIFLVSIFSITIAHGERAINPADYIFPIEGVARSYAATFGEFRPDHFHSGVDIKSDGVEGKRVVASMSGYVSRISLSPTGFGLAIYLAHPNGTTTVSAHLSALRPDLQEYLEEQRYKYKRHSINIFPEADEFPVEQGDLIGYSGNTGNSFGPHLHYEVRESGEQKPLNPVTLGLITPQDSIKPTFTALYYAETNTVDGVSHPAKIYKYPLTKGEDGNYTIEGDRLMWVGREGYFIVAATDRKEGTSSSFGLYSLSMKISNRLHYLYQQDGFRFDQTRYKNGVSYYPYQRLSSVENYRLKRLAGIPNDMFIYMRDEGVVYTAVGEQREVEIEAFDDMGNSSKLRFTYRGKDDKDCFRYEPQPEERIARYGEESHFEEEGLSVMIPNGALYESIIYNASQEKGAPKLPSKVKAVSPIYKVMDYNTPLHRAMTLSIDVTKESAHARMVYISPQGGYSVIGGECKDGRMVAATRSAGRFFVAIDEVAPTIKSFIKGDKVRFEVSDNFSGVARYDATVDGEWVALDRSRNIITYKPHGELKGKRHKMELTIEDGSGNVTTRKFNFRR